jgi:hypothetical protein
MTGTTDKTLEEFCSSCRKPKAALKTTYLCGLCRQMSCKECTQFLGGDAFSFLEKVSEDLRHSTYCQACYDDKVAPELSVYGQAMERAKQVYVFFKKHGYLRLIRRSKQMLKVRDCKDRDEVILRLAFFAAQQSYNSLIEVELTQEKVRNFGYQKSNWSGTGFPADVEPEKEDRKQPDLV